MRRVQWMKGAGEDDLWRVCLGGLHHSCRGIAFGGGWCREDMIGLAREQRLPCIRRDGAIFDHAFWCLQPQRQAIRESASLPDHVQQEPSGHLFLAVPVAASLGQIERCDGRDTNRLRGDVNAMRTALGPITHEACRACDPYDRRCRPFDRGQAQACS